ncbi:MAG TPA: hypothetical protein VK021_09660, partial [Flavobacteriaceae bacterium]|nr:hypothetical protein [Flavobacteriaceae bacterium]
TLGLVALCVAGIAIKIWAKKGGEFGGTCASQSPYLNEEGEPCDFCGNMPSNCGNEDKAIDHKKAS